MTPAALIRLVDQLRAHPTETEWLEFKRSQTDAQEIGEYLSALANEARLCSQPRGYLVANGPSPNGWPPVWARQSGAEALFKTFSLTWLDLNLTKGTV